MQPQMTGYPQQQQQPQQQQGSGFLQPQQTGNPGMSQFQRPMQTGFGYQQQQQQPQGLTPQQTGMMGGMGMQPGMQGQIRPQATSQFLSPAQTGMGMGMGMGMGGGLQPQPTGFMGGLQPQQTGFMGGLQPQQTGYMGAGGLQMQQTGLMPQMTGMPIRDPRMQLMSAQFLPASQPYSGAPVASNMNFSQASMQPSNFQSQIQNLSQQQQGSKEPRIPWALSKEERKSYDSIFRAWDAKGTGFINGEVAREVFGQSGLETDKLMQIWHLADTGNRGKLNVNEFHVAMGLIYRALNGNDVPETLPSELIPPSAKDLNDSVDFLKDLLKKDTNVRHSTGLNIPEAGSNSNASYAKARSFHENPVAPKKDATAYKHDDTDVAGYKSSSRHLDRKTVRYEGQSATDDLSEMKRQLENTQKLLDKQGADDDEDRELERELDDLRYRIRRVQDDIEYYNRRGGRDSADLRRKAERELMHLMHERLPQLEKRLEAKDSRQREKKLGESRERDRRNDPYGRYGSGSDDRDRLRSDDRGSSRSGSNLGDGEYLRGTFDRDDDRRKDYSSSRDRYDDRDSYRRQDDDRDRDAGRSTPSSSSQAPPPPPVEAAKPAPSPAPAAPAASSGPPKNMTAEERAAWIRSEAQRRVQERMRMLGAVAPAGPSAVDTSVEERLKAEQAEAAAKSAQADQEAAAREEARKARLEEQRLQNEKASLATVKQEIKEAEKGTNPIPAPVAQAAKEEIDDQEDLIRRREEVLAKEKAEREARLKRLEEQEEEARKQEEAFKERQTMFNSGGKAASSGLPPPSRKSAKGSAPPPPPPSRARAAPAPAAAASPATLAPPAPEAPPAPAQPSPTPSGSSSTNPFHRMQQGAGGAPASPASAAPAAPPAPATPAASTPRGTNPFFRPQQAAADTGLPAASRATPPVSAPPAPGAATPASRSVYTAPKHDDDDWEESDKDDDDDEADGPGTSTRATRQNLAQALFSNLIPSSGRSTPPASAPNAPAAPPAPPAAPGAPPAPAAPKAPVAPVIQPASGPVDRGALLGQIQGGLRLKKAQTNDRSKALVTGSVIGDASPPVQTYVPPPTPPAAPEAPALSSAVPSAPFTTLLMETHPFLLLHLRHLLHLLHLACLARSTLTLQLVTSTPATLTDRALIGPTAWPMTRPTPKALVSPPRSHRFARKPRRTARMRTRDLRIWMQFTNPPMATLLPLVRTKSRDMT